MASGRVPTTNSTFLSNFLRMSHKGKELLVFVLSRSGCLDYAGEMLNHLRGIKTTIFTSSFALVKMPDPYMEVPTFRNKKELLLNSLYFPLRLCVELLKAKRRGCTAAWFPVFHAWNPLLIYFCKILGIRTIVTVHDGQLHPGENHRFLQFFENSCFKLADHLVFLSDFVQKRTLQHITLKGTCHVVPHGLIPVKGNFDTRTFNRPPALLFLGRLAAYKGIDLLLEAIKGIPDNCFSHLTIAGEPINDLPKTEFRNKVRWITRRLNVNEMSKLLGEHDILVLPYREASQSGVLTMGISAAIPMVICRIGGMPEQLAPDEAVWVQPEASQIAGGIKKLIDSPQLWEEIHQKLRLKRLDSGWDSAADYIAKLVLTSD